MSSSSILERSFSIVSCCSFIISFLLFINTSIKRLINASYSHATLSTSWNRITKRSSETHWGICSHGMFLHLVSITLCTSRSAPIWQGEYLLVANTKLKQIIFCNFFLYHNYLIYLNSCLQLRHVPKKIFMFASAYLAFIRCFATF